MSKATYKEFLQTWDLVPGNHLGHPDAEKIITEINALIAKFVEKVYNKGLRKEIRESDLKELVGIFGGVRMNTYVLRGRVYVYFRSVGKDPEEKIVFVADDCNRQNPDMVLCDILVTNFEAAKKLVETVIDAWEKRIVKKSMREVRTRIEAIPTGCNASLPN